MFAAALLYSAKGVELSIYSTCKRISQKLLRNVQKFLNLIHEGLKVAPFKEVRCNMEEMVLQGPDGTTDIRTVNSYPSKVFLLLLVTFVIILLFSAQHHPVSMHGSIPLVAHVKVRGRLHLGARVDVSHLEGARRKLACANLSGRLL